MLCRRYITKSINNALNFVLLALAQQHKLLLLLLQYPYSAQIQASSCQIPNHITSCSV